MRHDSSYPACATRLHHAVDLATPRLLALPAETATHRTAPGRWSPIEILGHLMDSASNNHQRFVRAADQNDLVSRGTRRTIGYHASSISPRRGRRS